MNQKDIYGIEQARAQLPRIVAEAHAGAYSVISKHGKPYAAVVSLQELEKLQAARKAQRGLLALRGTGRGLWGSDVGKTVTELRDEWGDA